MWRGWTVWVGAACVVVVLGCGSTPSGGGGGSGTNNGIADNNGGNNLPTNNGIGNNGDGSSPIGAPNEVDPPLDLVDISAPATTVGDGSAASCTESALASAVRQGGVIVFDCGEEEVTIRITRTLEVTRDTVVDGEHRVFLDGGDAVRIMKLDTGNFEASGPTLTVQRLGFENGRSSGTAIPLGVDTDGGGGAIYHLGGSVHAIDCVFRANRCPEEGPDVAGGAIYGIGVGETVVVGSVFTNNRCSNGGAIGSLHTALTVANCALSGNRATGYGANSVDANGQQVGRGGNGGAISMDGRGRTLSILGSVLSGNQGGAFGGAVFRTSYEGEATIIARSSITDNRVGESTDTEGRAGGLYLQGSHVRVTDTTIARNAAAGFAGLWVLAHGPAAGVVDLTNVTLADNRTWPREDFTTEGIGGGLIVGDNTTGTLVNVTIVGNRAQFASGIARASGLTIRNSLIHNVFSNEWTPINCSGSAYASPPGAGSPNLQWPNGRQDDMDCTAGIVRADPMMGELGDHGGLGETMMPQAGSPAVGMGTDCPSTDQRGRPRDPSRCTLGAVEP